MSDQPKKDEKEEEEEQEQPGPSRRAEEQEEEKVEEDDDRSPHRTRTGGIDTMSQLAKMKAQKMAQLQRAGKSTAPRFGPRRTTSEVRQGGLQHLPGTGFALPSGLEQKLSDVTMEETPEFPFAPCSDAPTTTIHRSGQESDSRRPRRRLIKRFTSQNRPDPFAHFESQDQPEHVARKRARSEERKSKSSTDEETEPVTKRMVKKDEPSTSSKPPEE